MNEKNPEKIFKIKTSNDVLPERAAEEVKSTSDKEQPEFNLKVSKKELSLQDLMDFLQKNNLQPNEKIVENYYKEILENKKDREIISNTVKKLETKREEINQKVENDPNNKDIVKKLQELDDKISDLNTSEYLISDNIKNIVKNITNESKNINQNEENISNNILNQNIYDFLTNNTDQSSIENNENIVENLQQKIENNINPEPKENEKIKIDNIKTLENNKNLQKQEISDINQNLKDTKNEENVFENNFQEKIENTSNIFNDFLKESESLSINSDSINDKKILEPEFLKKDYNDDNRISLSNPIISNSIKNVESANVVNEISKENNLDNFNPIDSTIDSLESKNSIELKNDNIEDLNPLESFNDNNLTYEENIIDPANQDALNSIIDSSENIENNSLAQEDLLKTIKSVEDESVKRVEIEKPKMTKDGEYVDLNDINPVSEENNPLEGLNPAISENNESLKIKEPDLILDETRKTNNLLESLSKIMMDGFNGLMSGMSNISNNTGAKINENISNQNANSHMPNPKIIQPNWITGYRDGLRKGTGVSTALGYDTKLKGDNMGLYI